VSRLAWTAPTLLLAALLAAAAAPAVAQSPAPTAPWPTGDELRRSLQDVGFVFRIERDSGDWIGWAPLASISEAPALRLDGAGTREAAATFDFQLLGSDQAGMDIDATLTAVMEVAARLPLDPTDVEQARRFVVEDLLTHPPELLEPCYASTWDRGVALATIDRETAAAELRLASSSEAVETTTGQSGLADDECAPLIPAEVAAELGDPRTERLTIAMTAAAATSEEPAGFEPAEVTLEGALVTLVLTFRNDSAAEQTLTFQAPLAASTGPVAPGEVRLIVVRQLAPGTYPFFSETDPVALRGSVRIEAPS
jgi:hypothetical protein